MNLTQHMPTFARWFRTGKQRLVEMPRTPYVLFLLAYTLASTIFPLLMMVVDCPLFFAEAMLLWLPVVSGNVAILFWSRKHKQCRPSVLMRLLIMALVMEGFFLIMRYYNPQETPEYATMEEVVFMTVYGIHCVLLLIMEPGLRSLIRGKRIIRPVVDPGDYTRPF
ncbi:hypothetical protein FYZ48_15745 [Gimesia chilikensis]|uniref:hypothetical protein n=1 Tax=Gimesia chilikensis TaxID=2605989 RepID=UPI0011EBFEC4|nr:hypothetical protein [Gimesia chilikensis]KAA0137425.1 hypothetical protein FYZ48_15745 [Gimesia chilikensis]